MFYFCYATYVSILSYFSPIEVPVFCVVTMMDKCTTDPADEKEKKRTEIAAAIRIDPQRVLLCSNYQPNTPWDDKEDINILEFMCLVKY